MAPFYLKNKKVSLILYSGTILFFRLFYDICTACDSSFGLAAIILLFWRHL